MKTKYEIMKEAGGVLNDAFGLIFCDLRAGKDLGALNIEVGRFLADRGAISGLLLAGFPFNMSVSIDYEVVQGYPDRVVQDDHIISVDMSICYKGVFVDKARTIAMPSAEELKHKLASLVMSVVPTVSNKIYAGMGVGDLGGLIQAVLEQDPKFRACNYFHGHGIGDQMHESPMIPNYNNRSEESINEGQFITIEPIVYGYPIRRLFFDHRWTITSDELSAHAEDTVYIQNNGIEVLT
jgi:methionyl aminopeptidase